LKKKKQLIIPFLFGSLIVIATALAFSRILLLAGSKIYYDYEDLYLLF